MALQLQVAIKVSQDDEQAISSLLAIAEEAKAKELLARSKAEDATSIVNQLNLEVAALKRRLQVVESEKFSTESSLSIQNQLALTAEADHEVEVMMAREASVAVPQNVPRRVLQDATPFDRWKMNKLLYSSDTPAASADHDGQVVEMLLEAATMAMQQNSPTNPLRRTTVSSVGKIRPGARLTEQDPAEVAMRLQSRGSPVRRTERDYFLSEDVEQAWGGGMRSRIAPMPEAVIRTGGRRAVAASGNALSKKKSFRLSAISKSASSLPAENSLSSSLGAPFPASSVASRPSVVSRLSV